MARAIDTLVPESRSDYRPREDLLSPRAAALPPTTDEPGEGEAGMREVGPSTRTTCAVVNPEVDGIGVLSHTIFFLQFHYPRQRPGDRRRREY